MGKKFLFILDLDMTLVDSLKVFYKTYNNLLRKWLGKEITFQDFYRRFCEDSLDIPVGDKISFWDEFKKGYVPESINEIKLMPGARELVEDIKRKGYIMVIVSGRGTPSEQVRQELEYLGLNDYIKDILTLSWKIDDPSINPFDKKTAIKQVLEKYNPDECIVIGDYIEDMKAGKTNGCYNIGVTSGCKSPEKLKEAGADIVFDDLIQVRKFLQEKHIL